jgi:hypothetical protein
MHECPTKVTSRGRESLIVAGALAVLLSIYAPIYLPYLPNGKGGLGSDYSLWPRTRTHAKKSLPRRASYPYA